VVVERPVGTLFIKAGSAFAYPDMTVLVSDFWKAKRRG